MTVKRGAEGGRVERQMPGTGTFARPDNAGRGTRHTWEGVDRRMNARERFVATLTFGRPDRIPFIPGGPRESTLAAWHEQGLPRDADWWAYLLETLGFEAKLPWSHVDLGVDFRLIPLFEEKVLEHKGGHLIVQDWKGNICEISDRFDVSYLKTSKDFVTRRWLKCPVENRDDWERMKERYRVDAPGRFAADFEARCERECRRTDPLLVSFSGPFWQLREWCGFEGLCLLMADDPDLVAEMAAFWTEFVSQLLARIFLRVTPDMIYLSEDMAYKAHSMISPAMVRQFLVPSYRAWSHMARAAGVRLVGVDSDGYIGELIPIWLESGINLCDPMEIAAHNDIAEYRREYGHAVAYRGGIDKRAIARGGKTIRAELRHVEPVMRDGGYIPSCDHSVPGDISWPNFVDYSLLLAKMTGWL
jgi:uroporphyrinogen decarboxylase